MTTEQHERRVRANGLSHFVRISGADDAPPAILLHGFPDSSSLWDPVAPLLTAAGFRIVAPDLRGFGETDMAAHIGDYDISVGAAPDMLALMDALEIEKAHIVGHDFGAPVAWRLAAQHPARFFSLAAISVGHARAYLRGGFQQKRLSWYILMHQLRGLTELVYKAGDWTFLRRFWSGCDDVDEVIENLSRPGRLTAALNWYRANISVTRMLRPPAFGADGEEIVRIPTLGVWGAGDRYLGERQMMLSEDYVEAPWRYERLEGAGHWVPCSSPEKLSALLVDHWRSAAALPSPAESP